MKAITVEPKKPGTARYEDFPEPDVQDGSVLVEAVAVGVCGTDVEIVEGKYGWAPPGRRAWCWGMNPLAASLIPVQASPLKKATWWLESSAVRTRSPARIARWASGTCVAMASILSGASRRSTDLCRNVGASSLNTP